MRIRLAVFVLLASVSAFVPLACGDSASEPGRLPPLNGKEGGKDRGDPVEPPPTEDASGPFPDSSGGGPGRVYAHTDDSLYLYDPVSGTLTLIGKFSCLTTDAVVDIAVDRTGNMYATTFRRFLSVDPITANCTELATSSANDYPNSLSFVPAGTVDPTKEALVGYGGIGEAIDYVRISLEGTKGTMTKLGDMNASDAGTQYRASGDIISLIQDNNRTYVTVKVRGGTGTDLLAEIDPKNGNIKNIIGDTKENDLWGFGFWAGKGYGFSSIGRILEVDMKTGSAVVVKTLTDDAGAIPWYGAGVTTQAPIH